ncbi:MAG: aminoacyl-tRNA hydrolase [Chloroflexi bacterium]|nr:aminoacyl-tRNA hydrolase [Chloroflexota bacterium]
MSDTPHVILGLGNPGSEYAGNRHNAGAQCVALLARRHHLRFEHTWGAARVAQGAIAGTPVVLARSRAYMNESGLAAAALARRTDVSLDRLLVVYDEMDLPLGALRLRPRGSAGGHNGLTSVIEHLGSQDFPRLRIGVGHPVDPEERDRVGRSELEATVVRWLLSDFTRDELPAVQVALERAAAALECWLTEGVDAAMNRYNG